MPFTIEYHPQMVNPKLFKKLVSAGLNTIKMGIQTGSDHIRNAIFHRPGKSNDIIALANEIIDYGVTIRYDLIMENPYDTEESLKDCIKVLLQLPKPLSFNLYSLQYFPDYPLTRKAIEDGYIKTEEASIDSLMKKNFRNWSFTPKFLPYTKKQVLQNIIWLLVWGHAKDNIIRYGVFGDSFGSKVCFIYMNLKAVILGKIFGIGGIVWRHSWLQSLLNGVKYLLKGDLMTFYRKIRKYVWLQKPI